MIIKSQKKNDDQVNINIESADGTINVLQRKQKIKYLGVLLDETMSFNHHISYICTRTARNNSIISKLRHYLTLLQMKQIYYSLRTFARKFSNFLLGVTNFVLERTYPEEHLNLSKSGFVSEEGHSGCKSQNIAIRALKGNGLCQIWIEWTY